MAEDHRPNVFRDLGQSSAIIVLSGFILTFGPQFILGYLGMPRQYHVYPPEFQVLNVLSSAGASILAVGYLFVGIYLTASLFWGEVPVTTPGDRSRVDDAIAAAATLRDAAGRDRGGVSIRGGRLKLSDSVAAHAGSHGTHAAHHRDLQHHFDSLDQQHEAATLGMWLFLITEVLFFGGLFLAYMLYRVWYPVAWAEASRELDIVLGPSTPPC